MKLLGTRVLIQPEEAIKSFGNIVLPPAMHEQVNRGTVVLAGIKSTIKPGATVAYMKHQVVPLKYRGDDLVIVDDKGIYAVL